MIELMVLDKEGVRCAQGVVTEEHYLHAPVDVRCSVEGYGVYLRAGCVRIGPVGLFLLGRPEATKVRGWYGGIPELHAGKCEVTRWQVLNLARVLFHPDFQLRGRWYGPEVLPGFVDRHGAFRSTLASNAISAMAARAGFDYLVRRPPCFLDEPYQIEWLLSYGIDDLDTLCPNCCHCCDCDCGVLGFLALGLSNRIHRWRVRSARGKPWEIL